MCVNLLNPVLELIIGWVTWIFLFQLCVPDLSTLPYCLQQSLSEVSHRYNFCFQRAQAKVEQYCSTNDKVALVSETNGVRRSRRVLGMASTRNKHVWSHQYCFNKKQRAERLETIRTGKNQFASAGFFLFCFFCFFESQHS